MLDFDFIMRQFEPRLTEEEQVRRDMELWLINALEQEKRKKEDQNGH